MLERTAATLESCTSLHALPSASRSLRSRRKLHTGFWQHGAAAIDISSSTVATQPDSVSFPAPKSPIPSPETLAASTFLLDFLYPSGTVTFLRKLAPGLYDHHQASIHRLPRRSRPFTSSTVASPLQNHDSQSIRHGQATSTSVIEEHQELGHENPEQAEEEDAIRGIHDTHSGPSYDGAGSRPDLMRELMAERNTEYFGSIWQLYSQLEPSLQPELRPEVIVYLHRSGSLIDARRVSLLFSEIDATEWTTSILTSAVAAHLRLGRRIEALSLYHKGLSAKGMAGGLNQLLQYAFRDADWDMVKDVWVSYHASNAYCDSYVKRLRLSSVPGIGKLLIDFARFIRASKMQEEVAQMLNALLRQTAEVALQRPCEPEEALPLLQIVDSADMYVTYFRKAWQRGQRDHLPDIYRVYRKLANKAIPYGILHCMLDIFIPDDVLGLEQVYEDFHRAGSSGMDRHAFKRYLGFYASRGDTKSIERLVDTYRRRHGSKVAEIFGQMMNAYATLGDYDSARRVFDELRYKHRKPVTVYHWNLLLKSCLQSATYDRAISVFEEFGHHIRPNSVTFATIMSLAASKGDLEFTLNLLQKARHNNVEIDVEILKAVVKAYCLNNRFQDALVTCINAKEKNVSGDQAKLWNALLRRYSDRREFDEVCGIVALMEQHNIQMTSETHQLLLKALVDCKQVHPAYKVLRSLVRKQPSTLTQEHFTTVLEGGLRLRQLRWANKLDKMMRFHAGLPPSIGFRLAQARALLKDELLSNRQMSKEVDAVKDLMEYIRGLADDVKAMEMDAASVNNTQHAAKGADSLFRLRQLLIRATVLFTRYRRFDLVRELREMQASLGQEGVMLGPKNLSIDMLHSLMQENVHEKKYDAAKDNWELIWQKTLELAQPALPPRQGPSAVLPRYRYILSKPFETLQEVLMELRDPKSLKTALDRLLDAGFLLDGHSMNYACQVLAQMGLWLDACRLCERYLMPNWTGWRINRIRKGLKGNIPLGKRRKGSAPQWLRPTSYTLIVLAKEYSDLKGMIAWSSAAAEKARIVQEECPIVVNALKSLPYTGIGIEVDAFGRK
ncbi:pentatricopeptide repeat domain-containing protein [Colletotrichum graminicola]|uniref:Pentatricopeptide repeat domain-containing protein n=1 Tax=Colletotrichum graminicola (strain M1.001 / M2 / FGSC 10212) TaxID=645133 RepID=E3QQQ7_COLGM|nr:pentatricopeptide repeat domain-containing protein [Colletotrichum graminicola M1.001]EFQ33195.1 pentatricopeptide repeat domain-containing protein [Colletotrichum graminicola M1.001]WDK17474.1 pentatricopeptide repeat domain-containing protein [Colletotrichum graminicola]